MVISQLKRSRIKIKCLHKRKGKWRKAFVLDLGDVPVIHYNEQTNKFEAVDNPRGNAYATRNRLKFRRKKYDCRSLD